MPVGDPEINIKAGHDGLWAEFEIEPPVYVSSADMDYHRSECPRLADDAKATSRSKAEGSGFSPCSECKP